MPERKRDSEDNKFSIETSFKISHIEEADEIEFVIYHDERPALTAKVNLEAVLAVVRRYLFENSEGEFILQNYDSDPDKGGRLLSERVIKSREVLSDPELQPVINSWLFETLLYVLRWLPHSLSFTLGQLEYEAAIDFLKRQEKSDLGKVRVVVNNQNISIAKERLTIQRQSDEDTVDEFIQRQSKHIKERLGFRRRGGSTAEYDLSNLSRHFEIAYPMIKDAKRIYKQNRNIKWQTMVKSAYPEIPPDLIDRLADDPVLDDKTFEMVRRKGGSSAPQDVALEYAARLCGVPPYNYTPRHLKDVLSKQGMNVKKVKSKERA